MTTRARSDIVQHVLDVPADRLAAVVGTWAEPSILESGPGFGDAGRWSVLAAHPRLVFEVTGSSWSCTTDTRSVESGDGDPLAALAGLVDRFGLADAAEQPCADCPPFQGGLIGFIGYDLAPRLERLPRRSPRDSRMPDIRMALYDTAILIDARTGLTHLHAWDLTGEGRPAAARRCRRWIKRIDRAVHAPQRAASAVVRVPPPVSSFDRHAYMETVARVLEYIAAGDVFQVNLSQRFTACGSLRSAGSVSPAPGPEPRAVRGVPALGRPGGGVGQPRMVLPDARRPHRHAADQGDAAARPVARKTMPGSPPSSRHRPKDRAELTMIVDLERNDLGRVCRYGSVVVRDALVVESFAQVHHLVATVEGRLRPEIGPVDVIRAMFPGGSITGAPKIRAMEIIDELEPNRRSLYTGAIGYLSRGRYERLQYRDPHDPRRRRSGQLPGRRRDRRRLRPGIRVRGDPGQGPRACAVLEGQGGGLEP